MTPADSDASASAREPVSDFAALVDSAAGLAQSEFEALYTRTVPTLIAWVRVRAGGVQRGAVDAEDLVQETWTRAFESFDRFDPKRASFRAWIVGIAQHVLLETLRRHVRKPLGSRGVDMSSGFSQCPASITSVSRAVARADSIARFVEFIESLPQEDRDLVVMRGLEDRDFADVAQRLGISVEAVNKRWQRLLAQLRERAIGRDLVVDF